MRKDLTTALTLACAVVAVGHVAAFGHWIVEDAAISWAYVQNIAAGEGAVPWVGAEPVEGYSNPTWVGLLVLLQLAGVHVYWGTKLASMALTAATTFLVGALAARLAPERPGPTAVTAAALFAVNTQVGIFGAAGLENPLFNFLLAAGLVRLFAEQDDPARHPWSAGWFALLALTRPEGVAYGLVAGGLTTVVRLRQGRPLRGLAAWWAGFLGAYAVWHGLRYSYFAWALPATAYAKLPEGREHLWAWNGRSWRYLRGFFFDTGQGHFLPLYALAIGTTRGRSARIAGVLLLAGAVLYLYPAGPGRFATWGWQVPEGLDLSRCLFPFVAGALAWAATWDTPHFGTRGTTWALAMVTLFLALYASGDWMSGFRWLSMASVTGSVLLAVGLSELAGLVRAPSLAWARPLGLATGVLAFAIGQLGYSLEFSKHPDISPWHVRKRVWKGHEAVARLHIDERPRMLTVDMGAFLMWSGFELNDIVGLTDMPMAQHRHKPWFKPFFREHILDQRAPHFIRVGTVMTQLRQIPGFEDRYKQGPHHWRYRTDLLFSRDWPEPGRRVVFDGNALEGWTAPAPEVAVGSTLYLETGFSNTDHRELKWWAFVVDEAGRAVTGWELPVYVPETVDWPEDSVYVGRYSLALPSDLAPGRYTLGFAMRTRDAWNQPVDGAPLPEGAVVARTPEEALFRVGEVRFAEGFEVVTRDRAEAAALNHLAEAHQRATDGSCEQAARAWYLAQRHGLGLGWSERHDPEIRPALASCHHSRATTDPDHAVDHLEAAARLDPTVPGLAADRLALADTLEARGRKAHDAGELRAAQAAWTDALRLDPSRTWLRKATEEARTERFERVLAEQGR